MQNLTLARRYGESPSLVTKLRLVTRVRETLFRVRVAGAEPSKPRSNCRMLGMVVGGASPALRVLSPGHAAVFRAGSVSDGLSSTL